MYCPNCGRQVDDGVKFCSNCGAALGSAAAAAPAAPADDREIVIKEGLCNRIKSKLFVQNGRGMLTNKRFIYSKHGFGKILAMGVFVNLTKGTFDFDIPVSEIAAIRDGRQGVSKTIIVVTKSGDEYNFYFTDRERWIIEFNNLIKP